MTVLYAQLSSIGQIPNVSGMGIGMTQQSPEIVYLNTDNTLAQVLVTGYLNLAVHRYQLVVNNYQMALVYTTDQGDVWLRIKVTTSGGVNTYSLESTAEAGLVALPTVANQIVYATSTAGALAASGLATALFNAGNISAGLSGTAGALFSFPATATTGKLGLVGVANAGNFTVNISNASHAQNTTYSIADVGAATGGLLVSTTALRTKIVAGAAAAGGAAAQSFTDAFCTSASCVIGNWNTQANAASVLKIVPGNGSFVVTSSADAGIGTFNYIIAKA